MADPADDAEADRPFEAAVGEACADALLVFDATWHVRRSNDAAGALFGYGRDALRGRHVAELLAVGEEAPPENGRTVVHGWCRDGRELPLEAGVAAFREGGAHYRVVVFRDLRPQRRQQAVVDEQSMRLRELRCLHGLADEVRRDPPFATLLAHVGESLPQAMADPAASRVRVRVDEHAWVAGDWRDDAPRLTEPVRVTGRTRGAIDLIRLDGPAGDAAPFSQAERDTVRAVAVMLGETVERARKAQELARYAGELESFSYSVSHDLRAPLRALDGFSQALANRYPEALDERGRDYLQRIRRASRRMSGLIDALLRLSRISRKDMAWQPVDLSCLAREVIDDLQAVEPERAVTVRCPPGLRVWGDEALLRIVLQNLLGNAWKFSAGVAEPVIEFDRDPAVPGRYVVRDNGDGFDPRFADRLYGAFQRLHSESEFEGLGIGLVTVKRIVLRHGGDVGAQGRPGQGATFWFDLRPAPAAGGRTGDDGQDDSAG